MQKVKKTYHKLSAKGKTACWFLCMVLFFAVFAPFIACDEFKLAPIPYKPYTTDFANNNYVSPLEEQFELINGEKKIIRLYKRHWLGTNKLGEDVLSGIIHGARVSMTVGFFATVLSLFIGISIGLCAGYFGNDKIKISKASLLFVLIGLVPAYFYARVTTEIFFNTHAEISTLTVLLQFIFRICIFLFIVWMFYKAGYFIAKKSPYSKKISFPLDSLLMRFTEVVIALPALILIIAFAAITKPSIINLILIIGLIAWTDVARLVRAETLKIKNLDCITAAKALGYRNVTILLKHILPNILPVILSMAFFIFSAAILSESSLSFLGIGMPYQTITWGTLLAAAREEITAWWLFLFPGLMLTGTLICLHVLKEEIGK